MAPHRLEGFPGLRPGIAARWRIGPRSRPADSVLPMVHRVGYRVEGKPFGGERDPVGALVEAALFAADGPLTPRRLARLADLPDTGEARRQVARLNALYDRDDSAFHVEELAGGYRMLTRPSLRRMLERIYRADDESELSGPMIETLAIVAYRQPICRADIEAIRGVQVGELLRQLMDKGLVRFVGRDDSLGRPYLYGTTNSFLQTFGLRSLHELPLVELFRESVGARSAADSAPKATPSDGPHAPADDDSRTDESIDAEADDDR